MDSNRCTDWLSENIPRISSGTQAKENKGVAVRALHGQAGKEAILQVQHEAVVVVVLPRNFMQDLAFPREGSARYCCYAFKDMGVPRAKSNFNPPNMRRFNNVWACRVVRTRTPAGQR